MGLYGWLVGRWHLDVEIYPPSEPPCRTDGFASADWVLEGRAIQDVFAVPGLFYGSTMRVYDPALGAWHVLCGPTRSTKSTPPSSADVATTRSSTSVRSLPNSADRTENRHAELRPRSGGRSAT
jgi:hypothetical protein